MYETGSVELLHEMRAKHIAGTLTRAERFDDFIGSRVDDCDGVITGIRHGEEFLIRRQGERAGVTPG